jgi:hypothetical protein
VGVDITSSSSKSVFCDESVLKNYWLLSTKPGIKKLNSEDEKQIVIPHRLFQVEVPAF